MRKNIIKLMFIIFVVFISNKVIYSQINFWEPANANGSMKFNLWYRGLVVANNGDLWAAGGDKGLLLSTDNGDTWVKKHDGIFYCDGDPYSTPSGIWVFAIHPLNSSIFIGNHHGLYRSTDNGENWEHIIKGNWGEYEYEEGRMWWGPTTFVMAMLITPLGEIYVGIRNATTIDEGGVFYSNDNGETWIKKNNGLPLANFMPSSFALGTDGTVYVGNTSGYSGLYRLIDGGDTWLNCVSAEIEDLTVSDDGLIFAITGNEVLKSTDKGVNWNVLSNPNRDNGIYYDAFQRIVYNPITKHLFGCGRWGGVFRSTDFGENWYKINNGYPMGDRVGDSDNIMVYSLAVNSTTGMVFISVTDNGVYRSTEDINSVIDVDVSGYIEFDTIHQFVDYFSQNPFKDTVIYRDTVISITNRGTIDIIITDVNFILGYSAISYTFNGAVTIKPNESYSIPVKFVSTSFLFSDISCMLEMVSNIGNIRVSLNVPVNRYSVLSAEDLGDIPVTYNLSQNYPNPFNPSTNFRYSVPNKTDVRIAIYDLFGREIKTLVNEGKEAGTYNITWNGRDNNNRQVSTGVYFYKMQAGGFQKTMKMVLMK